MLGTIVNTSCIIAGSLIGSLARRAIKPKYRDALYNAMGLAALLLGTGAFVTNISKSEYPVLFIASLAIGSLAAPVLFLFQGSIYLVTRLAGDVISDSLMCEISIVGGVLIASSGLSILGIKDCRTLNMLPSLLVPVLFFIVRSLF